MSAPLPRLPIDAHLPAVLAALAAHGAVVVVAPPGAGKTTRIPPAILEAGLAGDGRVVVLQPRRVAARATAARMAAERGCPLGGEVGYHVRFDDRTGPRTRIEVLTEGLLTRRLQSDPFLSGVGCVVLDEFHERSLDADLALALLAEVRAAGREDLRIVVMSATLEAGPLTTFLGAPVIEAEGRAFEVAVRHVPGNEDRPLAVRCAAAIRTALAEAPPGHVLCFLPGVREIDATAAALAGLVGADGQPVAVLPLHGRLTPAAQDRALAPSDRPKVVLATNIAETSVTLAGVTAVVDSGLARVPRFDAAVGLTRLETGPISQASAVQRAGRAGRTAAGLCLRLYSEARFRQWPAQTLPEVRRADLANVVLDVRSWGADPDSFQWFETPEPEAIRRAELLLRHLGALDAQGLTPLGRTLAALPLHPRLSRLVVAGHAAGHLRTAAAIAALAAERDVYRTPPAVHADSDLELRLDALQRGDPAADPGALAQVRQVRDQLVAVVERALGRAPSPRGPADLAPLLLTGFFDRVAQRRAIGSDRFKLAGGGGARLDRSSAVREASLVLAVGLEGAPRGEANRNEHIIRSAMALDASTLPTSRVRHTRFDPERGAVVQTWQVRYLELVLAEHPVGGDGDPQAVAAALAEAAAAQPTRAFDQSAAGEWLARVRWLAAARPDLDLPNFAVLDTPGAPDALIEALCVGARSFADLRRLDLPGRLEGALSYAQRSALDRLAPERLTLPDGTSQRLVYGEPEAAPVLAARIQQVFGLRESPSVLGGARPVLMHLLAPNNRPAQITHDLKSFWANTYPEVRKDLRGRYPKHAWPDDPLTAPPQTRPTRRKPD